MQKAEEKLGDFYNKKSINKREDILQPQGKYRKEYLVAKHT